MSRPIMLRLLYVLTLFVLLCGYSPLWRPTSAVLVTRCGGTIYQRLEVPWGTPVVSYRLSGVPILTLPHGSYAVWTAPGCLASSTNYLW